MANKKVVGSQSPAPLLDTKKTDEESSSPGRLLTFHPMGADKEPPLTGKLHLPGPETEEVSPSWTIEP